jgi:hypothetical protein
MHCFLKFILGMKLYMFRTVPLSIIGSFSPYTQQCLMSYNFAESLWAGSRWNILILLDSCVQNCMTHTIAVFTVKNSWWCTKEHPDPARKLSAKLYVVYHCCVYSEKFLMMHKGTSWSCSQAVCKTVWHKPLLCVQWKLLTMDGGTVRNM